MNGTGLMQFNLNGMPSRRGMDANAQLTSEEITENSRGQIFSALLGGQLQPPPGSAQSIALRLQQQNVEFGGQYLPLDGNVLPGAVPEQTQFTLGLLSQESLTAPPSHVVLMSAAAVSVPGNGVNPIEEWLAGEGMPDEVVAPVQLSTMYQDPATVALNGQLNGQLSGSATQLLPEVLQGNRSTSPPLPPPFVASSVASSIATQATEGQTGLATFPGMLEGSSKAISLEMPVIDSRNIMGVDLAALQAKTALGAENAATLAANEADVQPLTSVSTLSSIMGEKPQSALLQRPATELQMYTPLNKPEWGSELGNRIAWMTNQEVQSARIRINPPHLGPIEVRISVHNDVANVSFVAQHVQVREALEMAIPRLREMMDTAGFLQTNVDVTEHSFANSRERFSSDGSDAESGEYADRDADVHEGGEDEVALSASVHGLNLGAIDYFA